MASATEPYRYVIKNLRGTTGRWCHCPSWLEHWRRYTGSYRATCAVVPCGRGAEVGAHVQLKGEGESSQWWIVPLCKSHNHYQNYEEMKIDVRTTLVAANRRYTCAT